MVLLLEREEGGGGLTSDDILCRPSVRSSVRQKSILGKNWQQLARLSAQVNETYVVSRSVGIAFIVSPID